ncbi:MAG: DNA integrity scanning diadenylate cyclase DisA [Thermoleophilia bacterium]|jgi:diadenylate cyclase
MLLDPRRNPKLANALRLLAPGTDLRLGINDIIKGHLGALIVIADPAEIEPLCSGGLALNIPFSSQMLYEVAKMDGAIVVDADLSTILRANVHLMPDAAMPTSETGTRHRTAERVARQTEAIVVAISQERDTVNVYTGGSRYQLDSIGDLLAKATQGLATLQGHRVQLDRGADELTTQELRGDVSLDDVINVLQRAEMAARMIGEIERNATELGLDGRLVAMQLAELSEGVVDERLAIIQDYRNADITDGIDMVLEQLAALKYGELVELECVARALGFSDRTAIELRPRGYRALAQVATLTEEETDRIIAAFPTYDALMRATLRELQAINGISPDDAAAVQQGLRRLHDRHLRTAG